MSTSILYVMTLFCLVLLPCSFSFLCRSSFLSAATSKATLSSEARDTEVAPTHLLTLDHRDSLNETKKAPVMLFELFDTNKSLLMASMAREEDSLRYFSRSLNQSEDCFVFKSTLIEEGDSIMIKKLTSLWEEEHLISETKDPLGLLQSQTPSFNETLFGYVRRMEVLHEDLKSDAELLDFLQRQNLSFPLRELHCNKTRSTEETLLILKQFAVWFRSIFPYYYDACLSCGNREGNVFVGYIRPSAEERVNRAGRTELYHCRSCHSLSRFPRFNYLNKVI